MRVVDLDRDMTDVIPTGTSRDSEFLFERMTQTTFEMVRPEPGRLILDVASGFGQDALALAEKGAEVIGAEPSLRMLAWSRLKSAEQPQLNAHWVQAWSDALPFATGTFDASYCKGALDHFDRPLAAIEEMARVTKRSGRVVLAIANFESLACRAARTLDGVREGVFGKTPKAGRRHYDVPSDHFTRYDLDLMLEQFQLFVEVKEVRGVSMAWGLPVWTRNVQKLPGFVANSLLRGFDTLARFTPSLADVVILSGHPKR